MAKDLRPERLYANHLEVGYNALEFMFDFGMYRHEDGTVRFHSGIVTTPGCADMFLRTLEAAIGEYKKIHGPIPAPIDETNE